MNKTNAASQFAYLNYVLKVCVLLSVTEEYARFGTLPKTLEYTRRVTQMWVSADFVLFESLEMKLKSNFLFLPIYSPIKVTFF